jgi:tRNA-specific 2-thiouridylase
LVQVRAHGDRVAAAIATDGDAVTIDLDDELLGVAPGQAAVLYDGTRVVGSSTIASTR